MNLQDKVILVTGGASGIGRAVVEKCAQLGAKLAIADRDVATGTAVLEYLTQHNTDAIFLETDVSQTTQVEEMVAQTVAHFGRLDGLVNNAGIEGHPSRTADAEEADFDQIMAVNVKGVWLGMKYALKQMVIQGRGAIVNIASVAGLVGAHSLPIYAASKHAVVGLTKSAALEYVRKGVRINAVCPAVIRTPMVERSMTALPQFAEATVNVNPMRRIGEPEEVASAVVWLLSEESSFTNGATVTVDGGFTAQ